MITEPRAIGTWPLIFSWIWYVALGDSPRFASIHGRSTAETLGDVAMTERREHYIPLRRTDLVQVLADDPSLSSSQATAFRRWCDLLSATLHFEYKRQTDDLKDAYAPFDPERTTVDLHGVSAEHRHERVGHVFERFDELMARANFTPLGERELDEATRLHSDWGINMAVDFSIFENQRLYARGDSMGTRRKRSWRTWWRFQEYQVPVYQRLALIVKLKPCPRLPSFVDTDAAFIKYFKEIPKADIEMLLPGTRVIMPGTQRIKLGGSLLSGLAILGYNLMTKVLATAVLGVQYLYGLIFALIGYGWRQYAGYQHARYAVSLRLTESLYYQSLANNSAVLHALLDEAEEQDGREAILAYFYLWQSGGAWTAAELDGMIERALESRAGITVDFEVDDALAKLVRLGLVRVQGSRYLAIPIEAALETLDRAWDNQFTYHAPIAAAA